MPNRRSRRKVSQKQKPKVKITFFLIVVSILLSLFYFFWKVQSLEKFIYVNKTEVGDAEIIIVDPKDDMVTKYIVPTDTQFEASGGYGSYKLASLWVLSEKDKLKGKLVTDTLAKNYSLPIYYWKDGKNSNLSLYQKVKVFFVNQENLSYEFEIKNKKIPDAILINFVDNRFLEDDLKIEIDDLTGTQTVIDRVSRVIEVLGGKISNNSKGYDEELDCEIVGKSSDLVTTVNNIFDCTTQIDKSLNTDLKIRLGVKFASRF